MQTANGAGALCQTVVKALAQWRHSLLTRVDKVQGPPRYKGPPSATCKNLCHEIITGTLLTSDTLTVSVEYYDIINSNFKPQSKILLLIYLLI